jgi:hypothetical protein
MRDTDRIGTMARTRTLCHREDPNRHHHYGGVAVVTATADQFAVEDRQRRTGAASCWRRSEARRR